MWEYLWICIPMFKLQSYHGYKQRLVLNFTTFYKDIISKLFTEVGDNSNRIPHSVSIMICRHVKMHLLIWWIYKTRDVASWYILILISISIFIQILILILIILWIILHIWKNVERNRFITKNLIKVIIT